MYAKEYLRECKKNITELKTTYTVELRKFVPKKSCLPKKSSVFYVFPVSYLAVK